MTTLIVKQNGNESINSNLRFTVLRTTVRKARYDSFIYDSYNAAKNRIDTLKNIFSGSWNYEIVIVE